MKTENKKLTDQTSRPAFTILSIIFNFIFSLDKCPNKSQRPLTATVTVLLRICQISPKAGNTGECRHGLID